MDKKVKRDVRQDFDAFVRDIKTQFSEQQKLIDQRVEQQNVLLEEMADFCKKRGEIEAQYATALDKLLRRQHAHFPNTALGRTWQSMLDNTRKLRDGHTFIAGNFSNKMGEYLTAVSGQFPLVCKRYRELHSSLQQEALARMKVFREKLDAYFLAYSKLAEDKAKASKCSSKVAANPAINASLGTSNNDSISSGTGASKKERELARAVKVVETSTENTTMARNEYLLAVASENVTLDRFLVTDFAFATFYIDWFFRKAMARAFRFALVGDAYSATAQRCEETLRSAIDDLDSYDLQFPGCVPFDGTNGTLSTNVDARVDPGVRGIVEQLWNTPGDHKALIELSPAAFVPRSLTFEPCRDDTEKAVRADSGSVGTMLMKICSGCREGSSDAYARIERLVMEMRRLKDEMASRLTESLDETMAAATGAALSSDSLALQPTEPYGSLDSLTLPSAMLNSPSNSHMAQVIARNTQETFAIADALLMKQREYFANERQFETVRTKLRQIEPVLRQYGVPNSTARPNVARLNVSTGPSGTRQRREVFGVRLVDYVELNREPIPIVLRSCIRFLTENALHHPGVFRISGSQPEILELRAKYNSGEDPIENVSAGGQGPDVNSVASLLKLYLRELPEPLLPPSLAQNLVDIRSTHQNDEIHVLSELRNALKTSAPSVHYVVLRYLFSFLNHVTAYDENMMDAHNLAVCFGPTVTQPLAYGENDRESSGVATGSSTPATLLAVSESTDLVTKQRSINEMIEDLIVNFSEVFDTDNISGPLYSPTTMTEDATDSTNNTLSRLANSNPATGRAASPENMPHSETDNKRSSVISGDSSSIADAVEETASGPLPQSVAALRTRSNSNSNTSESMSDAALSDGTKSAIAQKAGVVFRERGSDGSVPIRASAIEETKKSPSTLPLHYSASASGGHSPLIKPSTPKQASFDHPFRAPLESQAQVKEKVALGKTPSLSVGVKTAAYDALSKRSNSPGRSESDVNPSRGVRLAVSGGYSIGPLPGIGKTTASTTPLLTAVTILPDGDDRLSGVDDIDASKRPPPVARKPAVGKK